VAPFSRDNLWNFLLDQHLDLIKVKDRKMALKNLENIFSATFRLGNTVGFRAMSLRDLCKETGLSMGGLYGYIKNKYQIAAMIEDMERYVIEQMQTWFDHIESPVDKAECLIRSTIYLGETFQPWAFFVFFESRTLSPEQRDFAKGSELRLHRFIATLIEQTGKFNDEEAFLFAAHCLDFVEGWYVKRWKYLDAKISADKFADSAVKLFRAHVGCDTTAKTIQGTPLCPPRPTNR
jgi:AcrR family transcriptional regulator